MTAPKQLLPGPVSIEQMKEAMETINFQPQKQVLHETEDEKNLGASEEYDRLVLAFNEIAELERELRIKSTEIFQRHGLYQHGFAASVMTHYVSEWDQSKS
jgi:hypothetical protein